MAAHYPLLQWCKFSAHEERSDWRRMACAVVGLIKFPKTLLMVQNSWLRSFNRALQTGQGEVALQTSAGRREGRKGARGQQGVGGGRGVGRYEWASREAAVRGRTAHRGHL